MCVNYIRTYSTENIVTTSPYNMSCEYTYVCVYVHICEYVYVPMYICEMFAHSVYV